MQPVCFLPLKNFKLMPAVIFCYFEQDLSSLVFPSYLQFFSCFIF
uniref:Uncharacterized protein n=1 Tax=Tetraselmis sp. GSL018 TaxID=582737 RepID=A0A061SN37_9CHLO